MSRTEMLAAISGAWMLALTFSVAIDIERMVVLSTIMFVLFGLVAIVSLLNS